MARSTLLIATTNAHKITEFRRLLGDLEFDLLVPSDIDLHLEVNETGDSFEANARLKAHAFCLASGIPSLADDSGIEVDALGGRPGVFSARYGGNNLDDEGRVRLLLVSFWCWSQDNRKGSVAVRIHLDRRARQPQVQTALVGRE